MHRRLPVEESHPVDVGLPVDVLDHGMQHRLILRQAPVGGMVVGVDHRPVD